MRWLLTWGCSAALLAAIPASAQPVAAPAQCGPTAVGTSPVAVTFPAAGTTGPPSPTQYLTVVNPSSTATLWISSTTTAAVNGAGSIPLQTNGSTGATWTALLGVPPPQTLSIVASAPGTPFTCNYR